MSAIIKPYKISIAEEKLSKLKRKLALAEFPDELDGAEWDYGAPLADIKRLTKHWQEKYDWRAAEKKLNQMPQFTMPVEVEGFGPLQVHFVHQKSKLDNAIPLLFSHGWPGSFDEVQKILPELVEGGKDFPAFNVVAPSLPNFGFSEGTRKRGFGIKQHAEVCHKIMQALGYEEYVTQAGDIGYAVTRAMGLFYPQSCKASHINLTEHNSLKDASHTNHLFETLQESLSEFEKIGLKRTAWFQREGYGYNLEHCTKPQTIGYSMYDSPVGLLAWIYEKLHDWTDNYPWTDDEILTWISIYWFSTAGPHASQRIYYERYHDPDKLQARLNEYIPDVKLGIARFPKELLLLPSSWNKTLGPLVYQSESDKGGHFAAWERPGVIVEDLRTMFGKNGGAFAVVKGKTGYESAVE